MIVCCDGTLARTDVMDVFINTALTLVDSYLTLDIAVQFATLFSTKLLVLLTSFWNSLLSISTHIYITHTLPPPRASSNLPQLGVCDTEKPWMTNHNRAGSCLGSRECPFYTNTVQYWDFLPDVLFLTPFSATWNKANQELQSFLSTFLVPLLGTLMNHDKFVQKTDWQKLLLNCKLQFRLPIPAGYIITIAWIICC